jgi:diguanylate cyclase (GGDEF)-like protein/PAS domain S-box-containing protein
MTFFKQAATGVGLSALGAGVVELLLTAGVQPYAPVGWPGLGTIAASAVAGPAGFAGGALAAVAYYAYNFLNPARFADFFAGYFASFAWASAVTLLSWVAISLRARLQQARATAEALKSAHEELRAAHEELRAANERLEAALDGSKVALWDADLRSGKVYLSEAWADIVGAPRRESVATFDELFALLHVDDVEPVRRASEEALKGVRPAYAIEHRVRAASGEWRWLLSRGRVTERDPASGRALRMVGTNFDITDRKRVEEALQSVAQSDALTGLPNRTLFNDRLEHALARGRRSGQKVALLYLDIDRFKRINDTLGHAAGDALLREFAGRLRGCVRGTDTVARLGGDEFVVLLDGVVDELVATQVAEKVLAAMRAPIRAEGQEVGITTSVGVGLSAEDTTADALLRAADMALYEAKAAGRDTFRLASSAARPRLAGG